MSESLSFPPSEAPLPSTPSEAPQPRATSRRTLVLIVVALGGALLLCGVIAALTIGRAMLSVSTEQAALTPVIDRFMQTMTRRDANAAYYLFSSRSQRHTALADLTKMIDGPNYALFDGYQSVTIESTSLTSSINTDPDAPQGLVATVNGTVAYTGGVTGTFWATLEKEGGDWRLSAINVTIPPEKIKSSP